MTKHKENTEEKSFWSFLDIFCCNESTVDIVKQGYNRFDNLVKNVDLPGELLDILKNSALDKFKQVIFNKLDQMAGHERETQSAVKVFAYPQSSSDNQQIYGANSNSHNNNHQHNNQLKHFIEQNMPNLLKEHKHDLHDIIKQTVFNELKDKHKAALVCNKIESDIIFDCHYNNNSYVVNNSYTPILDCSQMRVTHDNQYSAEYHINDIHNVHDTYNYYS